MQESKIIDLLKKNLSNDITILKENLLDLDYLHNIFLILPSKNYIKGLSVLNNLFLKKIINDIDINEKVQFAIKCAAYSNNLSSAKVLLKYINLETKIDLFLNHQYFFNALKIKLDEHEENILIKQIIDELDGFTGFDYKDPKGSLIKINYACYIANIIEKKYIMNYKLSTIIEQYFYDNKYLINALFFAAHLNSNMVLKEVFDAIKPIITANGNIASIGDYNINTYDLYLALCYYGKNTFVLPINFNIAKLHRESMEYLKQKKLGKE